MTFTPTTIAFKDGANASQTAFAYTDGTSLTAAHPLLDSAGALISPATAGKQDTANTSLGNLDTNLGARADAAATTDTGTFSLIALVKRALSTLTTLSTASQAATPAGGNVIGRVGIDQTTPGTTNGVQINAALPAGSNAIGNVTANAGTNLNTSALAVESGGNLAAVATAQGTSGTGITQPTGGAGVLGWLSGIFNKLNTSVAVTGTFWQATQPVSGTVTANAGSGTFAVSGTVTTNAGSGTMAVSASSLPLPTGAATAVGQTAVQGSATGGTAATASELNGGVYNTSAPTLTNGQQAALQVDAAANLKVTLPNALPAGSNQIGSVALAAGSAVAGKVGIDQTTPGTTNLVQVGGSLPAGTAVVGKFTTDQTTHGTTDLVAADITKVGGSALALGQAVAGSSVPVVLPAAQITSLSAPVLGAGSAVVGKVGIDQASPGTTNRVAMNTAPQITAANATMTRPADTTAYANGDLVANSTTAASVAAFVVAAARGTDLPGRLTKCILKKSGTTTTNATFRVHIFASNPVASAPAAGDNGAFTPAAGGGWLGAFDVTVNQVFGDSSVGIGFPSLTGYVEFAPAAGTANVFALIEARAPYTPANAEVFTLTLVAE